MGAVVAPPLPAFYNNPITIDDQINHSVGRTLDLFDIDPGFVRRWAGKPTTTDKLSISANGSSESAASEDVI